MTGARRRARQVEQDRRDRAAIGGAVIDAAQHDQRAGGIEIECDREQHRDRRDRADAGHDADDGAERDADEAVEQIGRRQRDWKARARGWKAGRPSRHHGQRRKAIGRPTAYLKSTEQITARQRPSTSAPRSDSLSSARLEIR